MNTNHTMQNKEPYSKNNLQSLNSLWKIRPLTEQVRRALTRVGVPDYIYEAWKDKILICISRRWSDVHNLVLELKPRDNSEDEDEWTFEFVSLEEVEPEEEPTNEN